MIDSNYAVNVKDNENDRYICNFNAKKISGVINNLEEFKILFNIPPIRRNFIKRLFKRNENLNEFDPYGEERWYFS